MVYKYCGYWMTYSRALGTSLNGYQVEVDITPVNPHHAESWDKIHKIWIRAHCTASGRGDFLCSYLFRVMQERHPRLLSQLIANVDPDLLKILMEEDLLSQIDWVKYHAIDNGGAPFHAIKKD